MEFSEADTEADTITNLPVIIIRTMIIATAETKVNKT